MSRKMYILLVYKTHNKYNNFVKPKINIMLKSFLFQNQ